jgi:DNA-directed RNA polymerase I subunit RPA34.5
MKAVLEDMAGKQVWHITAPASIPLTLIKDFDLDAVKSGSPVLVHEGRHYALVTGSIESHQLLLPGETGCSYKRSKTSISKSYHLQEITKQLQPRDADKENRAPAFFAKAIPQAKPPREQPKMLKMRYIPFGADNDAIVSSTSKEIGHVEESISQSPAQDLPPLFARTPKQKKRDERSQRRQKGGLVDDPMVIDESPTPGGIAQELSSQADLPGSGVPREMKGAAEDLATPKEKRRKKKRMHAEASS